MQISERISLNLSRIKIDQTPDHIEKYIKLLKSGNDFEVKKMNSEDINLLISIFATMSLQTPSEDMFPRSIILCNEIDTCYQLEELFNQISFNTELKAIVTHDKAKIVQQRIDLYAGCDIVIGNPKRVCELYFQNGINLKQLKHFFIMELNQITLKNGLPSILRLNESLSKSQKVVFYDLEHPKLNTFLDEFLINPKIIKA